MIPSGGNPTKDVAEGATSACLRYGEEKIKELAMKFLTKELQFIKDEETIEIVRKQAKSSERKIYDKYVKDKDFRIIIGVGLTLRLYENLHNKKDVALLRQNTVNSKHGIKGLHIAEFVQNKLLFEYITDILTKEVTTVDVTRFTEDYLRNFETRSTFVQQEDEPESLVTQIVTRLTAQRTKSVLRICSGLNSRNRN